jgi:hypothetical protein
MTPKQMRAAVASLQKWKREKRLRSYVAKQLRLVGFDPDTIDELLSQHWDVNEQFSYIRRGR